ncbi:MAG: hypothetical protein L0Y66_18560 [Myxococcaceae bacterium]|nr:hypothetical protein [Myxococcaceae bacterium]MCI0674004.1 hypothetical protein [Myxococcaceae bacterium]
MGVLKFLVWTGCAVGLGIFLATHQHQGRTPLEHAQRAWSEHVSDERMAAWTGTVEGAWEDAHSAVSGEEPRKKAPRESHSAEDRKSLERLIRQRADKEAR